MMYIFKKTTLSVFLFLIYATSFSQKIDHWESIFQVGDSCKYFVPSAELGSQWTTKDYDDSAWLWGKSGFGFGDNDDNTQLPQGTRSVYLRMEFAVVNPSDIACLYLDMDYDDGFVAYLNGTEVARNNVKNPILWDMELNNDHEATLYLGIGPERYEKENFTTLLNQGKNVLVVEVHNKNASSSDLSANVFLHAGITIADSIYGPVPDWFVFAGPPAESKLPLMIINTNGQYIPDEPRIVADMGLIYNGPGLANRINDSWNAYNGKIAIEIRGESSSDFAKKSFSLELQNIDGSNNNRSLLGMPVENDFVLYGPFSDKTLVKNVLSYELFRQTGRWAPRTRYVEVIINDDYRGIYVLTEKIKRDENRVDIDKLTTDDVLPIDISGGYILRRDKKDGLLAAEWWQSPVVQPFHQQMWYEFYDPEYDELTPDQTNYIKSWMKSFDETLSGANFSDPENGYRKFIRTKSFIDLMFINEISKGIDNYLFSTYFYKENDADGGQLVAGPPWDYNLGYGNLNYGESWDAKETYGWCYPQGGRTYWFERLMEDEKYQKQVHCRWTQFRESIYKTENVMSIIDSCVFTLNDAVIRNFTRYPILGKYVWPGLAPFPETYEEEISNLKSWLTDRLTWMDSQWITTEVCTFEPPTDIYISTDSVPESQGIGSIVAILSTTDIDSEHHNYSLVEGLGDNDNSKFTIYSNKLLCNTTFDYAMQKVYSIRVKSTDESNQSIEKVFLIHVVKGLSLDPEKLFVADAYIYPNPSPNSIQIHSDQSLGNDLEVKLFEISGKLLFAYNGNLEAVNVQLMNDSQSLKSGVYLVKINMGGTMVSKRFVKI